MSQQSRTDLQTTINTDLASASSITAAELRTVVTNLNDSCVNKSTDGNILVAGGYAVTLTATATTGVTLPTSGTLLASGGALGTPSSGTLTNCTGLPQAGTVGLTTADSTQFTAVNVGHATDTTVTRVSAGVIAVEGSTVVVQGGALGTPASGTLTNCTGLPTAGIVDSAVTPAKLSTTAKTQSLGIVIDGGGSAITTGIKGDLKVTFACTITGAQLLADQSGSIVIDIWKDVLANYPPTVADTITASAKPTLSSQTNSNDTTLTGWTTTITAGDTLRFNVDSATTVTRVTLQLTVTRT